MPTPSTARGKNNPVAWSAFILSAALHAAALVLLGSCVIYEKFVPRGAFLAEDASIASPEYDEVVMPPLDEALPTPDVAQAVQDAASQPQSAPEGAASSEPDILISTAVNMQFTLPPAVAAPVNVSVPTLGSGTGRQGQGAGSGGKGVGVGLRNLSSLFGSKSSDESTLVGHFYDLKQDARGRPNNMASGAPGDHDSKNAIFAQTISAFLQTWDESLLNQYYRADRKLYSTQVFIPILNADEAPRAFEVERRVEPNRWLVHYKGTYTPPRSGTFCFAGVGDDILLVRFDNVLALNGSVYDIPGWGNAYRDNVGMFKIGDVMRYVRAGQWIRMRAGKSYPIEIIIGEIPGGQLAQFLMIMEEKKRYKERPGSMGYLLPVFQTAPTQLPPFTPEANAPAVLEVAPPDESP